MNNKLSVLITSPSLDINDNVSGIANLTNLLINNNSQINYILFVAGKKDNVKNDFFWLISQPLIFINFCFKLIINKIDIVHINMPLELFAIIRDYFFLLISTIFFKKTIIHIRGGAFNLNNKVPRLLKYLISFCLNYANQIIVLSVIEKDFLISYYNISKNKILVLSNCVKLPLKEHIDDNFNTKAEILYLGRLDKNKGLKEIVESLSQLKVDFKFEIAGTGSDKQWFLKECKKKIPDKYHYNGVVSGIDKINLLSKCNIFLLPSYYEGMPNALLEAMSYGLVPIITPVGSIPNIINNEENGFLVPIKDNIKIIHAIDMIIKNPKLFNTLSKNAIQTIRKNFSLNNYMIELNKLYVDLAKN